MAAATIAPGKGSAVTCNGTALKLTEWERVRSAGDLEFPTTGMAADADGNYEVPHAAGLVNTRIRISGPYDTATPFHGAPFSIRAGLTQAFRFGMVAAGPLTPSRNMVVLETTDANQAAEFGRWSATLAPSTDDSAGYFTG